MPKVERLTDQDGETECWHFECPGCGIGHAPYTKNRPGAPTWQFNGDVERPTFSPSLLVRWERHGKQMVCHSFVRDGRIEFLSDCTHEHAGKTLDLAEIEP